MWYGDTIEAMPPTGRFVPSADEVDEGWILTCESIPMSREVVIDYETNGRVGWPSSRQSCG